MRMIERIRYIVGRHRLWARLFFMVFLLFSILLVGSFGILWIEGLSLLDAVWFTVVTVLTVGYGDIVPHTTQGRIFALSLLPLGVSVATYSLATLSVLLIEETTSDEARRKRMLKQIQRLENHFIVCGYGRVGRRIVEELRERDANVVVIDRDTSRFEAVERVYFLEGEATDDSILLGAHVKKAKGIVAATPDDAVNVFVVISARALCQDIHIVGRAEAPGVEAKLLQAGADQVINPSSLSGTKMAMALLRPRSVDYIDSILKGYKGDFRIDEVTLKPGNPLIGKRFADVEQFRAHQLALIAVGRKNELVHAPDRDFVFANGDTLVLFGEREKMIRLERIFS